MTGKPRYRVRAHSWTPPTAAGLARWRTLLGEAQGMAAHWERSGLGLSAAAGRIFKDAYPSRDRADWPIVSQWVAACKIFAASSVAERAKLASGLHDLNAAVEAIMFVGKNQPSSYVAGPISGAMGAATAHQDDPPPAAQPNARRDIFE